MDPVIKNRRVKIKRGIRLSRRLERKRKLKRILLIVAGIVVLVGVLAGGFGFRFLGQFSKYLTSLKPKTASLNRNVESSGAPSKPKLGDKVIFLVMGVQTEDGKVSVDETLTLFCDLKEGILNGISIPKDTFIEIPGLGFERVGGMLSSGKDSTAVSAIQNLFGIELHGYVKLDYLDLERIMDKNDFEKVFKLAIDSDILSDHKEKISEAIEKMDPQEDISVVPLPVKNHAVGEGIYYEPDKDRMEELLAVLWGVRIKKEETVRAMVLNGCGVPGIAGEVADKLINMGYQVVGTKNADNFSYEETQILVYGEHNEVSTNIQKTLGVGIIVNRSITQDLADIVVVVGKDYVSDEGE